MNKEEKEIELLKIQRDSDKFNYNRSVFILVSKITILLTVFIVGIAIIGSYQELSILIRSIIMFYFLLLIIISGVNFYKDYEGQIHGHKTKFEMRSERLKGMLSEISSKPL